MPRVRLGEFIAAMLLVILCAWLSQAAPAAQQSPELLLLSRWVRSVDRHEPARADVEAATIAVWSRNDLRTTIETLRSLRDALQRAARADDARKDRPDIRTRSGRRLSALQAQTLLGLTDDEAQRGDINRLLKRGAMLHADIAMLAQEGLIRATEPDGAGDAAQRAGLSRFPTAGQVAPTMPTGTGRWPAPFSRSSRRSPPAMSGSTAGIGPRPRECVATACWRRRIRCSNGPDGCSRRTLPFRSTAGAFTRLKRLPPSRRCTRRPRRLSAAATASWLSGPHWSQAARLFTEALALQPAWPEARLRLGRVLGLLGRHNEAAAALRRALDETDDLPLVYWGSLFLGAEEQSLGRDAEARASFERARALRPGAQAPRLALSQLARRAGDRSQALAELRAVLTLPSDEVSRYDPLWDYYISRGSEANILFAELRRQLGTGGAPDAGVVR